MTLNANSLAALLDDFYEVVWEERRSKARPKGSKIRKVKTVETHDERTGKRGSAYTFETVMPRAEFLAAVGLPAVWVKLWRDAVWATIRGGSPQARAPYEKRADRAPAAHAPKQWAELRRFVKAQSTGRLHTVELAGPLFIGAQAVNAERVPFLGRVDEAFLLQFWPVVTRVCVPESLDREGKSFFGGYVLAIPDVSDLVGFSHDFPASLPQLTTDMSGYRPRDALISIPQEGALEYLHHVLGIARARAVEHEIHYSLASVEVYHLEKRGNSVHVLTTDRVVPAPDLLEDYEAIRTRYRDPLFRRQIILNLLRREPWYHGFDRLFAQEAHDRFVGAAASRFSRDASRRFGAVMEEGRSS
jgi:CRISPR-associated protein Cmx8